MKMFIKPFAEMFNFEGSASRLEFWFFFCFTLVLSFIFGMLSAIFKLPEIIRFLFLLIIGFTSLALGFRRLNEAGVNKFLFLIPFVNLILASLPPKK